jgi:hypothetical protein
MHGHGLMNVTYFVTEFAVRGPSNSPVGLSAPSVRAHSFGEGRNTRPAIFLGEIGGAT